jgi:hypothetical protein
MWKQLSKTWAWIEHIHTILWIIGIVGGAGMIANIIQYIVAYPMVQHFWNVFFISLFFLSLPFFISRYTRNIKLKQVDQNMPINVDLKSLINDARSLVLRITQENNDCYYFKQKLIESKVFLNLRPYLSKEFKSKLSNITKITNAIISQALLGETYPIVSDFLDEIDRLERQWNLFSDKEQKSLSYQMGKMGEWVTAKEAMDILGMSKNDFWLILIQKKLPVYNLFKAQINIRDFIIDNAWEGAREYARDSKNKDEYNISLIESGEKWERFKKTHIPTNWDHPARADEIYCIILFKKSDVETYKRELS